jgi:hypothetical protein
MELTRKLFVLPLIVLLVLNTPMMAWDSFS